jgi:hypothetical protein
MAKPAHYTSKVAIPLPSDEAVRRIMGNSFNPEKTLNVIKMFAGTEDMFEATIVRIPRQSGRGFRFDVGHRSDLIPATIPK